MSDRLTPATADVLADLRRHVEFRVPDGWGSVYLPHARSHSMAPHVFEAHLAQLTRLGLYRATRDPEAGEVAVETER